MGKVRAAKAARKVARDRLAGAEFWHGGIGGLAVGDEILPPTAQAAGAPGHSALYMDEARADRMYFTTDRELARVFASIALRGRGAGALYRVQPIGNVDTDPDFPAVGLHARRALILDVEELTSPLSSEEERRREAPYVTWDDGRPIYDANGRIQITWQMEQYGLTQSDLDRQLPAWIHPNDAADRVAALLGTRHA